MIGIRSLRGPAGVLAGTAVLGASGYGFLTLAAGAVFPADYAALASLYLLVAIGSGLFMALEQETTRVVSARLAEGQGTRDAIAQLLRSVTAVVLVTAIVLAALAPLLINRIFLGHAGLWWALLAAVVGNGGASVARGVLAARRRLGGYGLVLAINGLLRLLPCVALAVAGVTAPVPYGLALGLGGIASLITAMAMLTFGEPGPRLVWRELAAHASWLAVAWAASLLLANIAPVIVTAMLTEEPGRAGTFAFAFVLVRIPLFLLFALQSVLLPALTRAAATHDIPELRRGIRQALVLVGGLGIVVLAAAAPVGGWLIGALFQDAPVPSGATLTLLAAGTVLAMLVQVLQPALLAVASHRMVAAGWVGGGVVFVAAFLLPVDPVAAATVAQLAAGAVTAAIMALALRPRLAQSFQVGASAGRLPERAP